ncbi:hypothetical protein ACKE2W_06515, partial [Yersinia enterocolitica]
RLLRFAIQGLRSARRRHVLRVRSVGCALCAPRLALLATPCCEFKLTATALRHSGLAQCSPPSRTACTLRWLRAVRTQTSFARDALLGLKI